MSVRSEFPSVPEEAFEIQIDGTYYAREFARLRQEERLHEELYDETLSVYTAWDIGGAGGGDHTAIWFFQIWKREIRIIDYWEGSGYALGEIVELAIRAKSYRYATHVFPHDLRVREFGGGATRLDTARNLLGANVRVLPCGSIADGIESVRKILANARFDQSLARLGIVHLASYHREQGIDRPRHDSHSHAADAFRYLAVFAETLQKERPLGASFAIDYAIG